jgi:hypothetical protein
MANANANASNSPAALMNRTIFDCVVVCLAIMTSGGLPDNEHLDAGAESCSTDVSNI